MMEQNSILKAWQLAQEAEGSHVEIMKERKQTQNGMGL